MLLLQKLGKLSESLTRIHEVAMIVGVGGPFGQSPQQVEEQLQLKAGQRPQVAILGIVESRR